MSSTPACSRAATWSSMSMGDLLGLDVILGEYLPRDRPIDAGIGATQQFRTATKTSKLGSTRTPIQNAVHSDPVARYRRSWTSVQPGRPIRAG
jgi:hypothetical protein